jgi:hypothetical protein
MTRHYCDRCGAEAGDYEILRVWKRRVEGFSLRIGHYDEVELCEPCYEALLSWLKGDADG